MGGIKESIQKLAGNMPDTFVLGEVLKVDEEKQTVNVKPVNGDAEVYDVSLQPRAMAQGLVIYPKKGTHVLVAMMDETSGYVIMRDEIDVLRLKANDIDAHEALNKAFDLVSNLISLLANEYTLMTNTGATIKVRPDITAKLERKKQDLKNVQKSFNQLIKPF